jgi:hypothetical protein
MPPPYRLSSVLPTSVCALLLSTAAYALVDRADGRDPADPAAADDSGTVPATPHQYEAPAPPILRLEPLIELRWLEVFGTTMQRPAGRDESAAPPPTNHLPAGPMYRRDI